MAGILGSERVVAWFDLNTPKFATLTPQERTGDDGTAQIVYHRRGRSQHRTAISRYDFEFAFRLKVIDAAVARTSRDDPPMVLPVSVPECDRCPWQGPCHDDMTASDDVSLVAGVGYAEWRVHRFMGTNTVRQLAELDLDTARRMATGTEIGDAAASTADHVTAEHVTAEYATTPLPASKLVQQIESARAALAGGLLVAPDWDESAIPRGDIEIDLDLESDGVVYLWGARLSRVPADWPDTVGSYEAFASFDASLDEAALVARLWEWLDDLRTRAARDDRTVRVYGYSMASTEGAHLKRIAAMGGTGVPNLATIESFIASEQWVDLLPYMRRKFWSNRGHGLKVVAVESGFAWHDDDPGGYASMKWYRDAVSGIDRDANIARLLRYNEDDCAATAALRGV
jgi:predicted RecB family nuclease